MKKIFTLFVFVISFSAFAQVDAFEISLNSKFWFSIAPHDSVVEDYTDSIGALNGDVQQSIDYRTFGLIDSSFYTYASFSTDGKIISTKTGNVVSVYELEVFSSGPADTINYLNFYQNNLGQDTLVEVFFNDGTTLTKEQEIRQSFDTQGLLSNLVISGDDGTGSLVEVLEIITFRSNGRIDSANFDVILSPGNTFTSQKAKNVFVGGKHKAFNIYSLDFNSGTYNLELQYIFKHNSNNEITEAVAYTVDANGTSTFDFRQAFLRRKASTITISEVRLPEVSLYPNPATEYVKVAGLTTFLYTVYNVQGAEVLKGKSQTGVLDVSALPKGIYTVKLEGEKLLLAKLIKQ